MCTCSSAFSKEHSEQVLIEIKELEYYGPGPIKVSEIAHVSSKSEGLRRLLSDFEIPLPEDKQWLTKNVVNNLIQKQFSEIKDIHVRGNKRVYLKRCVLIKHSVIEDFIFSSLNSTLNDHQRVSSVDLIIDKKTLCRSKPIKKLSLLNSNLNNIFEKSRFTVLANQDDKFTIEVLLKLEENQFILKKDVMSQGPIESSTPRQWQSVKHLDLSEKPITLDNLIAVKNLKTGTKLDNKNTKKQPVISQGETVSFIMRDGLIEIKGKARSLNNGQIGDEVNIMLESNNKSIRAKVVKKGVVVVSH